MNINNHKALIATLKSIGRGLWFAILGLVVVALTALATSGNISDMGVTIAGFTVNLSVIILAVVAFAAKSIDTYIHKNQNIDSNGIAPGFLQGNTGTQPTPVPPVAPYVPPVFTPTVAPIAPVEAPAPVVEQPAPVEQPAAPEQPVATPVTDPVTPAPTEPTPPTAQ